MDRKSNTPGSSTASSLLQKLDNDLKQNASDKESIAAEEAIAKSSAVRRYHFRVMKKADYLEKKRIADTLSAAAGNTDISDDDLEALLRSYLKDTPKNKPASGQSAPAYTSNTPIPKTAEPTDTPAAITSAQAADFPADSTASPEQKTTKKINLDQPLTSPKAPFFEESAPESVIDDTAASVPFDNQMHSDDDDLEALLEMLPEDDLDLDAVSETESETVQDTHMQDAAAQNIPVPDNSPAPTGNPVKIESASSENGSLREALTAHEANAAHEAIASQAEHPAQEEEDHSVSANTTEKPKDTIPAYDILPDEDPLRQGALGVIDAAIPEENFIPEDNSFRLHDVIEPAAFDGNQPADPLTPAAEVLDAAAADDPVKSAEPPQEFDAEDALETLLDMDLQKNKDEPFTAAPAPADPDNQPENALVRDDTSNSEEIAANAARTEEPVFSEKTAAEPDIDQNRADENQLSSTQSMTDNDLDALLDSILDDDTADLLLSLDSTEEEDAEMGSGMEKGAVRAESAPAPASAYGSKPAESVQNAADNDTDALPVMEEEVLFTEAAPPQTKDLSDNSNTKTAHSPYHSNTSTQKGNTPISDEELEAMLTAMENEDSPIAEDFPTEAPAAKSAASAVQTQQTAEPPRAMQDTEMLSADDFDDSLLDDIPDSLLGLTDEMADTDTGTAAPETAAAPVVTAADTYDDTDLSQDDLLALADTILTDGENAASDTDAAHTADSNQTMDASDAIKQLLEDTDPTETPPASDKTAAASDEKPEEFDQTDLDLMIAFGMEDQLEKTVGSERAKKYKKAIGERGEDHYNKMHQGDRPDTVQDKHAEYVSAAQNKEIFSEYKKKYGNLLFRFLGALFFLILLFFFENNTLLGIAMPSIFDREQYPLVYTLFDLQLVLFSCAMVWHGIRTGIRAMLRARPVPESITGFLFLACIVYTVIIAMLCPIHNLQLYNFPIALAVLFELCYEFMNLRREIMSFKVVSSKKLKYAVDAISKKDGEAERRMFAEYISDDPALFRIKRTAFVEGFFQRTETYPRTQRILRTVLPAVLLLTLSFFAAEFILNGTVYTSITVSYITLLLTLPSCAFIMFSYPMYRASGFAYEKESAMIGEASLGEYADASVVTFDDKEVFPARGIRVRNVKVYGENRIDHVIYAAASVFHVVGGPLAEVFETATGELGYAENVKLLRLDRDGIEARVETGTVLVGRAAFVNRYGYNVSLGESEKSMEETGDACILYVAYDNNIAAKLYIQYSVEPDFEAVLKQLYRQGICVGIKTSDPNIDDHLLSCKIKMSKYPVKIIKCAEPKETAIIVDRLSSGIVSKSSAKSLLQTLAICDRVLSASRTNNVIGIVSILLGMAAMAFFVVTGMTITAAPLFVALYQLFWIIPVIAVSRYYI
ncbi:MAG: hypothetical protein J6I50_10255 [Clostridia bacterium]|nr:hypothetical protein [Clostridia bacterium]